MPTSNIEFVYFHDDDNYDKNDLEQKVPFFFYQNEYHKISYIRRTKSLHLNVSRLVSQLSLPYPLKPGVKLRMKM